MKNIFKSAYFGKLYKTRDGRKALFIRKNTDKHFPYDILIEGNLGCIMYDETGKYVGEGPHAYDIVSEWYEEINEKELDELAEHYIQEKEGEIIRHPLLYEVKDCLEIYKAGYHKAKEN